MFEKIIKVLFKVVPDNWVFPIISGHLSGYKWISAAASGYGKGLSVLINKSEPQQLDLVKQNITKDDICFDIGANVGMYTLMFSKFGKFVYAIEPLHRNIFYLYRHLYLNKIKNVSLVSFAFYSNTNLSSFYHEGQFSEGKLSDIGNVLTITSTIDAFVEKFNLKPTVFKIDVEGSELEVLRGGSQYLSLHYGLKIFLSVHSDQLRKDCLDYLRSLGFENIKPVDVPELENATEFLITK